MRLEPRAWSVAANMSIRRHIGNPEVRARSGSERRRERAHRKRLHVGREEQPATSAARKPGRGPLEEGSGDGREAGRTWGDAAPRPLSGRGRPPSRACLLYAGIYRREERSAKRHSFFPSEGLQSRSGSYKT